MNENEHEKGIEVFSSNKIKTIFSIDFTNRLDWIYFPQNKIDFFSPSKSKLRPGLDYDTAVSLQRQLPVHITARFQATRPASAEPKAGL